MNPVRTLTLVALLAAASQAHAASLLTTTDAVLGAIMGTVDATSDATSSLRDAKVIAAARDDAASFVASQGAIRGARLEAALRHIRAQAPQAVADDMTLAQAILVH